VSLTAPTPTPSLPVNGEPVIFVNRYRMGDSIALLHLANWLRQTCGTTEFYLRFPNAMLTDFWPLFLNGEAFSFHDEQHAPAHAVEFDDINLWMWNDAFYRLRERIAEGEGLLDPCVTFTPTRQRHYRIVFAPLVEADYSAERIMHPRFVTKVAQMIAERFPDDAIIIGDQYSTHDLRMIRETGLPVLVNAPLGEVVNIIGNCELFIGGDTGLSHVAGCFPEVRQVALHDRKNTELHNETEFDHLKTNRTAIYVLSGLETRYRSTACKVGTEVLLFDNGGMDDRTASAVSRILSRFA
jgi:hypothetical protein